MLKELKHPSLYYLQNLHAKCYLNEQNMIIGSMNLYEFSEKNNREMGVLLSLEGDNEVFEDAVQEVGSIINAATPQKPKQVSYASSRPNQPAKKVRERKSSGKAFCIRCGTGIRFNQDAPLCSDCFKEWVKYGNEDYEEDFCHKCGKEADTSKAVPLCASCLVVTSIMR